MSSHKELRGVKRSKEQSRVVTKSPKDSIWVKGFQ